MRFTLLAAVALMLAALAPAYILAGGMPVAARIRAEQARPAANDELYRMAETRTVAVLSGTPRATTTNNDRSMSLGPIIGLICGIVASSVAFGFALSLRRRINQIAGPVPEKDDDE